MGLGMARESRNEETEMDDGLMAGGDWELSVKIYYIPSFWCFFYPHDAMLAQVLAVALCLSQVGVLSKGLNESSWLLAWELPLASFKNKVTPLWKFVQNFGIRKFCFGISIVETCYRLSWRRINWTVRRSTKLIIPPSPSSDARPL